MKTRIAFITGSLMLCAAALANGGGDTWRPQIAETVSGAFSHGNLLARIGEADLTSFEAPDAIESDLIDSGGIPALRLTYTGGESISVTIAEVPLTAPLPGRLVYEAEMACESTAGGACLEMHVVSGGQAYFSRALNDRFSGTQAFRPTSAPFFFKDSDQAEAARLGVRFEGPGTVTIRNLALWEADSTWPIGAWAGVVFGILGAAGGIWGGVAGMLASRGRGRRGVLAGTAAFAVLGALMMLAGLILWSAGATWDAWYPTAYGGGLIGAIFGIGYIMIRRRYAEAEQRRMEAMDLQ
ncbi:MAG: hypothetical protein KF886_12355 [Candidatus Hydrogenedentes bacterium]|nr:hypothetical protein [Candidatus Hydrogenedentota bacterium]